MASEQEALLLLQGIRDAEALRNGGMPFSREHVWYAENPYILAKADLQDANKRLDPQYQPIDDAGAPVDVLQQELSSEQVIAITARVNAVTKSNKEHLGFDGLDPSDMRALDMTIIPALLKKVQ